MAVVATPTTVFRLEDLYDALAVPADLPGLSGMTDLGGLRMIAADRVALVLVTMGDMPLEQFGVKVSA